MRRCCPVRGPIFRRTLFLLMLGLTAFFLFPADKIPGPSTAAPLFTWELLYAGSWTKAFKTDEPAPLGELLFGDGTLANKGEVILGIPRLRLGFRFLGLDKRKVPGDNGIFFRDGGARGFSPNFGVYFDGADFLGNSRLLYGGIDEYGLSNRTRNVWAKSPPFAENRRPSMADLKTEPSSQSAESYLYLGFPLPLFCTGFVSAKIDGALSPALGAGLDFRSGGAGARLEGFYTRKTLAARKSSAWFSAEPPLPEREFRLFGFAASFETARWGLASDFAWSETFAFGGGLYGNAGLWIAFSPWKISLAFDAAESRYAGSDGAAPGPGLRIACRAERTWPRSGVLRLNTVFRSPRTDVNFGQGLFSLYFRPSSPRGKAVPPFRFTAGSLSVGRNLAAAKPHDTFDALARFGVYALRLSFSAGIRCGTEAGAVNAADTGQFLFAPPFFASFESGVFACEAAYGFGNFRFGIKSGYTLHFEKPGAWDFSISGTFFAGKLGRLGLKIASPEFPAKWNYTLSWRLGRVLF